MARSIQTWTEEEDALVRQQYPSVGSAVAECLVKRTKAAVYTRARNLGVSYTRDNSGHVKTTVEDRAEIISLYRSGLSGIKIAEQFPFTADVVYKVLREAGVKRSRKGQRNRKLTEDQEAEIVRRYKSGDGCVTLGRAFKVSPTTITAVLDRRKVMRRKGGAVSSKRCFPWTDRGGRKFVFRSSWELVGAFLLDKSGCSWRYEVNPFLLPGKLTAKLRQSYYTPDFWVYADDGSLLKLIDVKGYLRDAQSRRIESFRSSYPGLTLEIWDLDELVRQGVPPDVLASKNVAVKYCNGV